MASRQDVQKRQVWAERLGRYRASGLTVARFCASEGVSVHTFFYWSKRIETGSAAVPPSPRSATADRRREPAGHSHLKVGAASSALVRFHVSAMVEISVPVDCLDAIRCLANCLRHWRAERTDDFQEVVVAAR